ncbi:MAG: alpha/beta fold hydrolase [Minwuiales bacterium]|nr:alpha/beta fold hydrolase [Minwuiales bacterium]
MLPWHPSLAAAAANLTTELAAAEPGGLAAAVGAEIQDRLGALMAGIQAYHDHPYRRDLPEPPVLRREGGTRLLDYNSDAADGRPVLFVPSLVNRYYVLDLMQDRSLVRWLAGLGFRPLVVDWGDLGETERQFDLTDYIDGRLGRALDAAVAAGGGPVPVVGYCMGGNLALALACRRAADVAALALLATPWNFHADLAEQARLFATGGDAWNGVLAALGELPVDLLQTFFAMLDPNLAIRKFTAFGRMDPASDEARRFVALEDWLNDGVPLAGPVARECLVGWYGENGPYRGEWRVGGQPVDPAAFTAPTLLAIPDNDRIVPPGSARALAAAMPHAQVITPPSGHIGMVVGGQSEAGLWRPLADWLAS